eukprot:jgi/Mesvir1/27441/Mv07228-RA.1
MQEPPAEFTCPISREVMQDPVMLVETGQIYERREIEQWFALGWATDPVTNLKVTDQKLVPLLHLRSLIEQWRERERLGVTGAEMLITQDRLTLGKVLHRGPQANVREATLQPMGNEVAVKMFHVADLPEEDAAQFRKEVRILRQASLYCRNVCHLIGVAEIDGQLCMVMPRYEASLHKSLQQQRTESMKRSHPTKLHPVRCGLPLADTLSISVDIALAIADLHDQHILVLDLKPANVLLDKHGRAVVADFGISKLVNSTLARHMPTSKQGSYHYSAPEQFDPRSYGGISTAADAWAFACIVVEMTSGNPPWAGLDDREIITAMIGPQKKIPDIPSGLPAALTDLLRRCFSYQPASRPKFPEILAVLRQVVRGQMEAIGAAQQTSRAISVVCQLGSERRLVPSGSCSSRPTTAPRSNNCTILVKHKGAVLNGFWPKVFVGSGLAFIGHVLFG